MKLNACLLELTFALVCYSSRSIAAQNESHQEGKATYLVIYRPGPAWLVGKSVLEQPLKEHGKYMLSLYINTVSWAHRESMAVTSEFHIWQAGL